MGDGSQHGADPRANQPPLRAVDTPLGPADALPATRLRREFKGLTVADLACADLVERLPGRVRTALHHIECGDLAAAERALPGTFAPVLPGPGRGRRRRQRWQRMAVAALLAAAIATALVVRP